MSASATQGGHNYHLLAFIQVNPGKPVPESSNTPQVHQTQQTPEKKWQHRSCNTARKPTHSSKPGPRL